MLGVSSGKRSTVKYSKEDVSNEKVGAPKRRAYNELFVRPNTKENKNHQLIRQIEVERMCRWSGWLMTDMDVY